ncbi:LysR family transcriptional regulator [Pararhizobium polonicum]|uniref:HTH-type transcriptional regulator TtuA n=1 Tax=Pararhizobium polonicum TaxID=1612624 RepID=A0A1C7NT81_9HYPH|nr:LysR family transcriptional regulator [Pararhizobium polonicum]OBZ92197.1 LysR family transcriptional regulator [Pararhizobium polonicum]
MEHFNLNRLAYFAAVVDAGSFTKAARRLGITKTVVSQQVARLEEELKTSLLLRTTRRVEPTEAGLLFYARCASILREAHDAIGEVTRSNASPEGVLRIAAPNDYGVSRIAPIAAAFTQRYPACKIELLLDDARADLVAEHIDLSIRVGWLDDSSHQAKRIGTFRQLLVAAPGLVDLTGLTEPEDVSGLPFIANLALKEPLLWRFSRPDFDRRIVRMRQSIMTNSTPAVLVATIAQGGVSVLPDFLADEHIATGGLVRLLRDWSLPSGGIHVVYPAARFRPPKVSAFVAMLTE